VTISVQTNAVKTAMDNKQFIEAVTLRGRSVIFVLNLCVYIIEYIVEREKGKEREDQLL